MDRNAQNGVHQRRHAIARRAKASQAVEFFKVLTRPALLERTEPVLPKHRERLYPPTVALSMFMHQLLEADGSCQKAVNGWAAQRAADGLSPISVHTGGYAQVPVDELMRRPLQVRPVRGGHVLVRGGVIAASAAQGVTGHALVGLETLHQGLGDAQIHRGAKQRVGHAVAAGHLAGLWTSS